MARARSARQPHCTPERLVEAGLVAQAAWAAAEAEQRRVLASRGPSIDMNALGDMHVLHSHITEALRLFPPLIMLLRKANAAFAVETSAGRRHVVPKVGGRARRVGCWIWRPSD